MIVRAITGLSGCIAAGVLFVGCGRAPRMVGSTWQRHDVSACQARLSSDIALPLKITPLNHAMGHNTFAYTVRKTRAELADFYAHEMERLGWVLLGRIETDELLLIFDKLHKLCVVSLRDLSFCQAALRTAWRNGSSVRIDVVHKSPGFV